MDIGVARERRNYESRVGLTPAGVAVFAVSGALGPDTVAYLLAKKAALGTNTGMLMAMATVVVLRLAAIFFGLHVPRLVLKEDEQS